MSRARLLVPVLVLSALAACRDIAPALDAAPDGDGFPYPPPRTNVVPPVGSPDTLEIAAWNIENFPAEAHTPAYVADLITSLDLDVVVVEEIANETAWRELLDRLREHDGILSTHVYSTNEYQKIGVIYRTSMVTPGEMKLLFTTDSYAFPRPPLSLPLTIDDHRHPALHLEVIGVHLKAGVADADGARRQLAVQQLDAHLRTQINQGGEDEVIIAGDYNEVLTTPVGQTNLAAFLTAPDHYTVRTEANATNGEISFVPSGRLLDHITTTAALASPLASARVVIPRLQSIYSGYVDHVSDHLPVVLVVPFPPAP
ncbi:MAG TPA: endonuclease/exonuclease/phosphatase family protein [Kofleriaceae bacterium]|nr:endonuclease/exonuclease/phosphatase family protein [Kofleriaceae bacterium]